MKKLVIIMFCILLAKITNAQCDWEWIDYVDFEYIADSVALIDGDTAYIINDETYVICGDTINVCDIDLSDYDEDSKDINLDYCWHDINCDSHEPLICVHNSFSLPFDENPQYNQTGNNDYNPIDNVSYNYYKNDNIFGKDASLGCGPRAITVACYLYKTPFVLPWEFIPNAVYNSDTNNVGANILLRFMGEMSNEIHLWSLNGIKAVKTAVTVNAMKKKLKEYFSVDITGKQQLNCGFVGEQRKQLKKGGASILAMYNERFGLFPRHYSVVVGAAREDGNTILYVNSDGNLKYMYNLTSQSNPTQGYKYKSFYIERKIFGRGTYSVNLAESKYAKGYKLTANEPEINNLSVDDCMSYVIEYDKECKLTGTVNVPADVNYFIIRQTPDFK